MPARTPCEKVCAGAGAWSVRTAVLFVGLVIGRSSGLEGWSSFGLLPYCPKHA
ncbi:hypothetical protein GCM10009809_18150 [Isoptericola hypogeus]|uniref:Uncharacterized protein n=1 Tax=Isoptericola hypogeus TaxID=300179 RepID=A0ABN2JCT4_9MICO